ncbi:uncharacterized protein LOC106165465 [Lingula anatina]|uniref:Uncharacterized protein LOC106165465 n=1 Tax=Lingula anatina TaxID=7574 RepID=A0A1S3IMK2_LINAN|nr:uncharacterized protein LOC106165465 [Lingula anatina]|eukprot:XP_013399126.1 uncharacterized protein LOC106165465 [Lingula anatina]
MEALHTFIILVILWTGTESTHLTWQLDQSSPAHTVTTCTGQNLALHCSSNTIIRLRNMKMSSSTGCPNHNCRGWLCMARCYVSPALQQRLATSCSGRQACNLTITTNDMRRGSTNTINYNHLEVGYDCEPSKNASVSTIILFTVIHYLTSIFFTTLLVFYLTQISTPSLNYYYIMIKCQHI